MSLWREHAAFLNNFSETLHHFHVPEIHDALVPTLMKHIEGGNNPPSPSVLQVPGQDTCSLARFRTTDSPSWEAQHRPGTVLCVSYEEDVRLLLQDRSRLFHCAILHRKLLPVISRSIPRQGASCQDGVRQVSIRNKALHRGRVVRRAARD